jgi:serine/threonine protein kinase
MSPVVGRLAEQVGRYPVLGEIGRGGMEVVLHGRDPNLGRDLALKVMLSDCAGRPDVVQRFREEAQVGGQLQHPGVVPVYELGSAQDEICEPAAECGTTGEGTGPADQVVGFRKNGQLLPFIDIF